MTVPVKVKVIDAAGAVVSSFGGSGGTTQYAEDTAHVSGDQLTMVGVVQQTADAALAGNGDRAVLQVDENGYLKVNVKTNTAQATLGLRAEDSPSTSGDTAMFVVGIRNDDLADRTSAAGDYSTFSVDRFGRMKVIQEKITSTANSSTTPLGSGATFTGTLEDVSAFVNVSVMVFADQASATDGLKIEWSSDGTNIDDSNLFNVSASVGRRLSFGIKSRYVRVRYVNGGSAQATFRLQTIFHAAAPVHDEVIQYAEDTAHVSGDQLIMAGAVQQTADAALAGNGDRAVLQVDENGYLKVHVKTVATGGGVQAEDAVHGVGSSGVFILCVRNDNAATTFTSTNGDYSPLGVDALGRIFTRILSASAAVTSVADTTTSTQLLPATPGRLGAFIVNDSSARLHIKYGGTATTTDYTVSLAQHEKHELLFGFTGVLHGIWATDPNDGAARITELT